jgi:hypothetical protein
LPCTCRNSDPNSSLPAGADGCEVTPEAALRELAVQTAALRHALLAPNLLGTRGAQLVAPAPVPLLGDWLELGPGLGNRALPETEEDDDPITTTTRKEPSYGYL